VKTVNAGQGDRKRKTEWTSFRLRARDCSPIVFFREGMFSRTSTKVTVVRSGFEMGTKTLQGLGSAPRWSDRGLRRDEQRMSSGEFVRLQI
jgi:hypothetical protein